MPDLSGRWARNSFAYETPSVGLGPVENASRLPSGERDRTMLVGDYTNPILTPDTAQIVKRFGEITRSGIGFPDPNNQCWVTLRSDGRESLRGFLEAPAGCEEAVCVTGNR